jgi:hypothetical protein
MSNAKDIDLMTPAEMASLKTDLEIEYVDCKDPLEKRMIHLQIETLGELIKGRKLLKEVDSLLAS